VKELRCKLLKIHEQIMVDMVTGLYKNNMVSLPVFGSLPEGFVVQGVNYSPQHLAFFVRIFHESYPIVPMGQLMDVINGEGTMITVDLSELEEFRKMKALTDGK